MNQVTLSCALEDSQHGTALVRVVFYDASQIAVDTKEMVVQRPSGTIQISWNGKDDFGNPLPKGVYLFTIEALGEGVGDVYATDIYRSGMVNYPWLHLNDIVIRLDPYDPATGLVTIKTRYALLEPFGKPATSSKVEIFDPDLNIIASGSGGTAVNDPNTPSSSWRYNSVDLDVLAIRGGIYTILISALDDEDAIDKNHRDRPMLQRGARLYIPEAHNYDVSDSATGGRGSTPSATIALNHQKLLPDETWYVAKAWTDASPVQAFNNIAAFRPAIVYIAAHGDQTGGYIDISGGGWGWTGIPTPFAHLPIRGKDFSSIKFIAFVGCCTAKTSAVGGNLLDESVAAGATTAQGFLEPIGIALHIGDPTSGVGQPWGVWTIEFWSAALGWQDFDLDGRWDPPMTVLAASRHAAGVIDERWGGAITGWDSYSFRGNDALVLAPAIIGL